MKKSILSIVLSLVLLFSMTTPVSAATAGKTVTTFNDTITIPNVTKTSDPYTDKAFDMAATDKTLEVSDNHRSGNDNNELYYCDTAPVTITLNETTPINGYGDYGINGYQIYCVDEASAPIFDISKYNVSVYDYDSGEKVPAQAFTGTITITKPGTYYLFLTNYSASGKDCDAGIYIVVGDGSTSTTSTTTTVQVTDITLSKSKVLLVTGKTSTLKATVVPETATDKLVTWKSSNTKIATVDKNGKVTAVAAGSVTITATTADGSKKSATCKVTVTKPVTTSTPKVTGIANNKYYKADVTIKFTNVTVKLDGKAVKSGVKVSANGKHKFLYTDKKKVSKTITFYIDKKRPVITMRDSSNATLKSGVTTTGQVTVTWTDNNYASINITCDGNTLMVITNKAIVTDAGAYIVKATDDAGNVTTAKFTIK